MLYKTVFILTGILLFGFIVFFVRVYFLQRNTNSDPMQITVSENQSRIESESMYNDILQEEQNTAEQPVKDQNVAQQQVVQEKPEQKIIYPVHQDISVTVFWIGEKADGDNKNISNKKSAWDEDWKKHFGGVDDPDDRKGYYPAKFVPQENPFYFALPYNDLNEDGELKDDVLTVIPWAKEQKLKKEETICKNRWIKIIHSNTIAYAQWEDVGPFKENDQAYVFGTELPKSKTNDHAGLDVSPAVRDYLKLGDVDVVDWQFIDEADVPDGPWKKIITTSNVCFF